MMVGGLSPSTGSGMKGKRLRMKSKGAQDDGWGAQSFDRLRMMGKGAQSFDRLRMKNKGVQSFDRLRMKSERLRMMVGGLSPSTGSG